MPVLMTRKEQVSADQKISIDDLIREELAGKADAVAKYDDMLWKIRSGYAILLYGALGIVPALLANDLAAVNWQAAPAVVILVFGFSVFGALLDCYFSARKLLVIEWRDRLIGLTYARAEETCAFLNVPSKGILECLKNSGEQAEWKDLFRKKVITLPLVLYGGTCVLCSCAVWLLLSTES